MVKALWKESRKAVHLEASDGRGLREGWEYLMAEYSPHQSSHFTSEPKHKELSAS